MGQGKQHIDLAVIVPLNEELEAMYDVLPFKSDLSGTGEYLISELQSPASDLRVCLIKQRQMGHSSARAAARYLCDRYAVGVLCSYGIAGALSNDLSLGDVCVAQALYDPADQAKATDATAGIDISFSPRKFDIDRGICSRLAMLTQNPELKEKRIEWHDSCELYIEDFLKRRDIVSTPEIKAAARPKVYFGSFMSYMVSASDTLKQTMKSIDRKALVVETEGSGVFAAAEDIQGISVISIRGVSDFANVGKSTFEQSTGNLYRCIAARNAAAYIEAQLRNYFFVDYVKSLRHIRENQSLSIQKGDSMASFLNDVERRIESNLREMCPVYRTKSKGYVLPPPRITIQNAERIFTGHDASSIYEISAAVEKYDRILIALAPTYPDKALSWVVADHILRTNGDRVYIPFVLDGSNVRPNRFRLADEPGFSEVMLTGAASTTAVVILDEPNIRSKTRVDCLIKEASKYPNAKFIVILKDQNMVASAPDFCPVFDCYMFWVRDFSLHALSNFLSCNFHIPSKEAGVAATRLNRVFEQFNMQAHPTYFATISQDVLSTLMDANRRSDLIGLAVDGSLILLVASDSSDVIVSKKIRRKFLSDIVVVQDIEGEAVGNSTAVSMVNRTAEEMDIEIDAIEFIKAFTDAGLLAFEQGRAVFPCTYVRDYLLAEYLSRNVEAARAYFDFDSIQTDINVLGIYAEIGVHDDVIDKILTLMEDDIRFLNRESASSSDFLVNDKAIPTSFKTLSRVKARRKQLHDAIKYVGDNPSDLARKQQILDFRNSVSRWVVRRNETASGDDMPEERYVNGEEEQKYDHEDESVRYARVKNHWMAGCVLIGSGAESITMEPKRRLAGMLIHLGNRLAESLTARFANIDFVKIKEAVLSGLEFQEIKRGKSDEEWRELERLFESMADNLQYTALTTPYMFVLRMLCSSGQGNILRKTIRECQAEGLFNEITRAIWACDLDPSSSGRVTMKVFRKLGYARLLRYMVAEHFVDRAYWDKWKERDRQSMLDMAEHLIEPLNMTLNKGKIARRIARSVRNV